MREVPPALQRHLDTGCTTVCILLKITLTAVEPNVSYGLTTLDKDIDYESVNYSAINGFDPSVIASDLGYSVDNAEGYALLAADIPGITVEAVNRGDLDGATWEMLLVDYNELDDEHIILDAGDVGEVKVINDVVFIPELVSYIMRLRTSIGHVWSNTCRAVFGTPASAQTGCGIDAVALFSNGAVLAADSTEPKRVFTADFGVTPPARLEWLTGPNTSSVRLYVVEEFDRGGLTLFDSMPYPIEVGDTYRIRPDCAKTSDACIGYGNIINMKGEPLRPVGVELTAPAPLVSKPRKPRHDSLSL